MGKMKHFACLLALVCTAAAVAVRKAPFRSQRSPADTIWDYDAVSPIITHKEGNGPHPHKLEVKISVAEETIKLNLEMNTNLIAPHFKSTHFDEAGREIFTKDFENCYYHGEVEGHPEWSVTMSTCQGLQGSFGDIKDKKNYYQMEPFSCNDTSLEQLHALYLTSEYQDHESHCGTSHKHGEHSAVDLPHLEGVNMTELRVRRQSSTTRFLELVIVNDFAQYNSRNRNLASTVRRALDLANHADNLFRLLSIRIILVDAITWTNGDQISATSDPEVYLDRFVDYKPQITSQHDAAMLITGIDIAGSTVGIAFISAICGRSGVGLTQDTRRSVDSVGGIMAHELGHLFGMNHDDGRTCNCQDPTNTCIMAGFSGFPPATRWSSCSISDLNNGLFGFNNLQRCLGNVPTTTVGDPVCGNGIQEEGEVCDCGSPEECTDPCCNARTCQLADGAECSAGPCCQSTCQFRSYGTTCRAATGQCDIEEYCSGDSSECPVDTGLQDGSSCNSNTAYCYDGVCQTYDDQCRFHFDTSKGSDVCYSTYNTRGDQFGNCGHTSSSFIPCSTSDVQCGQLHCVVGNYQQTADVFVTILTVSAFNPSTFSVDRCRSFTSQPGSDEMSPGLVQDGTKCGNDRLCLRQRCVPRSNLNVPACPSGSNGLICSGNGKCNNNGQCSCDVGFDGGSCQSVFSGPDANECNTNNGGCAQICTNTPGSRVCSCRSGFILASDGRSCQESLTVSITVDYTRPAGFNGGPDEYLAASGPVRVTCTATGPGSGTISYRWSSTCRSCPFQTATSSLVARAAVHSGDTGTHTCVATRGGSTASASIDMRIVGAGGQVFRGSPRGNHPNNGLVVSESVGSGFRFRIFFRSDSMSANVGEIIGLNGNALSSNSFFAIARGQPGEITIANTVGSQSALTASQQGVYTCRIPLQNGVRREINIGIYASGFNTPPRITSLTSQPSSSSTSLTCTSTASPATAVTWRRNGQPVTIGGIYQMTQTVTNRAAATYVNVLTVNQPLASVLGDSFTCTVTNELESDTSDSVQVTAVAVNECETNNGGCAQICTDTATSFQCSCRSGFTLATNGRSCNDINECNTNNGGCAQICTNTQGSRVCSCGAGFTLASDGRNCQEALTVSITVDYTRPAGFNGGPDEYLAASGPVTVTCTATGPGSGTISYQWSSSCRSCPFQTATSSSIRRAAVHSGDTGTHTCVATRGGSTASASIDIRIVGAGVQVFRGSPRGNHPNNGLVVSESVGSGFRFRIFCRSDSMSANVGEIIGLNGNALSSNSFFAIARGQPGEITIANTVGSQSALTASQQGVYTCRIPLQNGVRREINIGIYPSGFNTSPRITSLTSQPSSSSSSLTCTSTGSPATTVTWRRDGQPITIGGIYQMTQTVTNRAAATYVNVLTVNQPLASVLGDSFTCTVTNELGSDTSDSVQVTATPVNVNECETNNGGCAQICTDTANSFECSCNSGFTLATNGRSCNDINECNTNNGGCEQTCTNTQGSRVCSCGAGFTLVSNGNCQDINECNTNNGGCEQICTNIPGSRVCSCRSGFRPASDSTTCQDINECAVSNGGCEQTCTNTPGSRQCGCNAGFALASNGISCTATEQHTCSISIDYTRPDDFNGDPNEYRAASGPVTVTCTATGPGSGTTSCQWSSTCRSCVFQSATSCSIRRGAVHSGDTGIHTCACTRGGNTATSSIAFGVVDAGIHIFRGSPRGNLPLSNGLVVSDNPSGSDYRFRIFCRSDSMTGNVGEFIGLDGNVLSSNSIFDIASSQPGEISVQNRVGSQNSLSASQEGIYTCRIPLQNGEIREINVGVYSSGFNTPPTVVSSSTSNGLESATGTSSSSSTLTCTTAGSPPTTVSWMRDGQSLTIDGSTYEMAQTVINRASATFENVLTINQPLASIVGSTFSCTVTNVLGSDTSDGLQVPTTVNECETNNGGCAQICTDTASSFQCSCRSGFRLGTDGRSCNDNNEYNTNNGGCAQVCANTPGSRQCSCMPGFTLDSNGISCTEHLTVSISVDYTPPTDFTPGPNEYRAASGPVTVTCTASGPGTGAVSYQWSSTCRSCPFQSATSNVIRRAAVHSGDTGTHTCTATQNGISASASINFQVVGSGIQLFRGSPRGSLPNNGLAISENPGSGFRLRLFCRSDSMSQNVGQFIGLNGMVLTSNSFFATARPQPGEVTMENVVGSQSALTASQQGVYTCRIPLQSGEMKEINVGIYPNGFNTQPSIAGLTLQQTSTSSFAITCTTFGSPATSVTWRRNGQPVTIDGNTFEMTQTVTNRAASVYANVLIVNQSRSSFSGNTITCTVENSLGTASATSFLP